MKNVIKNILAIVWWLSLILLGALADADLELMDTLFWVAVCMITWVAIAKLFDLLDEDKTNTQKVEKYGNQ